MSRQRDLIQKAAKDCGLVIAQLSWEPVGISLEMQGPSGGWYVETADGKFVAYNAKDICEQMRNWKKHGMPLNDKGCEAVWDCM